MVDFTAEGSRTSEQVIADDADLQAGIGDLAGLVAGSLGLPELLAEVAAFAVRAIPGADGAGVTLLHVDRTDNMVAALAASAPYAAELGELFAKPAAVAVHNAQILAGALARTVQLQSALSTRTVIDQAIGLIRGRTGRTAEDAFAQLRAMSQAEDRKLADVAQHIVDDAVRCARARHSPT
jgi:ANTAR domain